MQTQNYTLCRAIIQVTLPDGIDMGQSWICSKCENTTYVKDKIRTTGSGLTRLLDIQNRKFTVVSCERCGYSELYRDFPGSAAGNILDFMIG
jgi:hypothetical protein